MKENKPAKPMVSFRIDPAVREALKEEAKATERTISWLINNYLKQGMAYSAPVRQETASANN